MRKGFFFILGVVFAIKCFGVQAISVTPRSIKGVWIGQNSRKQNLKTLNATKFEKWVAYYNGDFHWMFCISDSVEALTHFIPSDFAGAQYPCWIKGVKHLFYEHPACLWESDQFKFRIYADDADSVLHESPVLNAPHTPGLQTATEYDLGADSLKIESGGFWVSIYEPKFGDSAFSITSDIKFTGHSYIRTAGGAWDSLWWHPDSSGELATYVYLAYTPLEYDVAPISYTNPPCSVIVDTAYPVSFTVKNKGADTASFTAGCMILNESMVPVYQDSFTVESLASGASDVVTLGDWTPVLYEHTYNIIFATYLPADMVPQNDTLLGQSITYEVSVEEISSYAEFKISHSMNPVKDYFLIEYAVPTRMDVSINLYDITGSLVRTLENGILNAGNYKKEVNTAELSTGIYFLKAEAGKSIKTQKLILLK